MAAGRSYLGRAAKAPSGQYGSLADLHYDAGEDGSPQAGIPIKHAAAKQALQQRHIAQCNKWYFQLRQGFSLLMYGYGSKHALLQQLAGTTFQDGGVLEVNGLFPGLTARKLLLQAACMLKRATESHFKGCSAEALLEQIRQDKRLAPLYVVLHNIEGSGLRSAEAQMLLSHLAACPGVHLVASMDHVNTPLLWDKQAAARFNWLYHDVTTYAPYTRECVNVPSLLVGRREEATLHSAAVVLRSLLPNARAIFRLIAEQQLEPGSESGLSHARLLRLCQERFLLSSDVTLRSHLTEFKDHQLVQTRRAGDGTEVLVVQMAQGTLQELLQEMDTIE